MTLWINRSNKVFTCQRYRNMLSHKAALSLPSAIIRAGCSRHIPASSVALSRIVSMHQCRGNTSVSSSFKSDPTPPRFLTTAKVYQPPKVSYYQTYPPLNHRRLMSTHHICDPIDNNIAKNLSPEDFDSEFAHLYSHIGSIFTQTQIPSLYVPTSLPLW